jgi:hypothetical protein
MWAMRGNALFHEKKIFPAALAPGSFAERFPDARAGV